MSVTLEGVLEEYARILNRTDEAISDAQVAAVLASECDWTIQGARTIVELART